MRQREQFGESRLLSVFSQTRRLAFGGRRAGLQTPKLHSGTMVRFRLGSVVCPDQQRVLCSLSGLVELTGNVVLVSDYGRKKDHFAIIDVEGVSVPLIVRADELSVVAGTAKEADAQSIISPALRQA